jgi:anti-anti-sigma factor
MSATSGRRNVSYRTDPSWSVDYLSSPLEGHGGEDDIAGFRVQPGPDGVLYLSGELEMATAESFAIDALARLNGRREVCLDLSALSFIDSTGIRSLLQLAELAAPRKVVLRHCRPNVDSVLRIVNIDALGIRVEP